ncbi:MAG: LysR substrate-binding domain-containing protein [Martelella sp.]|uniref:LysR substrate-binding domain-containing protein n=1 Tax=Martelella sp. TaxID=1969699 RepID=UPI003242988F
MKDLRHLPLQTLRTFEATARHGSMARAAAELNLTDSAVSHQLRRLEGDLGYDLFEKAGRGIRLTDAGQLFHKTVAKALQDILSTAVMLSEQPLAGGRLDIACPPMFASAWLAKNIADFSERHPTVECHIRLIENHLVPETADVDLGIMFGQGGWPNRWSARLADVDITPVCSPVLFQRLEYATPDAGALKNCLLLHRDDGAEWRRWLSECGHGDVFDRVRHLYCSDLGIAIDLALNGVGFALASETLTRNDIRQGRLIRPFGFSIDAFGGWYVVTQLHSLERAGPRLFLHWLLAAFGQDDMINTLPSPD